MDKVRIAIIGCGNVSQLNVPGYLRHPDCEVYALCSRTPGRAEARAKQWGISPKIYTGYEQVLNDPRVDAVELLVPHNLSHENDRRRTGRRQARILPEADVQIGGRG